MTISGDATLVAYRFVKRLTQNNAHVLDHMVSVNLEVAGGFNMNINHPVARNLRKHMVKKRQAGSKMAVTGSV